MGLNSLPPYQYIDTEAEWEGCLSNLQQEPRLAIDLESNSLFAYQESICLIQISTPQQDYIIDPLAEVNLEGLGAIIEDAAVEKIFHAGEYDMILMKREHGWEMQKLFDTMWAARILGYERVGLANMLNELFNVELNKRFQRANWGKRPLSAAQLAYAQSDTHYLFHLRDYLAQELEANGRMAEAQEIFKQQTHIKISSTEFDPESFWSISGAHKLPPRNQAVLKSLNIYRHKEAARRDQPLFKIIGDKTLIKLARTMPQNLNQLRQINGIGERQAQYHGRQILKAIQRGKRAPIPERPPPPPRPADEVVGRYEKLHQWRKERGSQRGVESDVIISRDALWALAKKNPQTAEELSQIRKLGDWQRDQYGSEILAILTNESKSN